MSALHRFGVTGGPHPGKMAPTLDGEPLRGVISFHVDVDLRTPQRRATVTVTMVAELDVDIEADVLFDPTSPNPLPVLERLRRWWRRMRRHLRPREV